MGKKKSLKRVMSVDDLNLSEDVSSVSTSPTGVSGKTDRKRICKSRRYGGDAVASTQPAGPTSSLGVSQLDVNNQVRSAVPISATDEFNETEFQKLKAEVIELKNTIGTLTTQIKFLLSFVGAVDSSPPHTQIASRSEFVPALAQSGQDGSASSYAEVSRQPATQAAGVSVGHVTMREAAVTAMYMEKAESDRREASFIVSGLPTSNSASDRECITHIIESELGVRPVISFTKRLGQRLSDKPQPLLVYLKDTAQAQHIVSQARQLRHSQDEYVRRTVYINKNLTKAAARAAYELRCRRRQSTGWQPASHRVVQQRGPVNAGSLSSSIPNSVQSAIVRPSEVLSAEQSAHSVMSDDRSDQHRGMSSSLNVEVPPFVPQSDNP